MDCEWGLGCELAEELEDLIRSFAAKYSLKNKTPWHDMAGWIIHELEAVRRKDG